MTPLSRREEEVADLIAEGLSNKLIAVRLNISEHTAKFHVYNVCKKYKTSSRVVVAVSHTVAKMTRPKEPACVS